ncbi:hypothetical protein [Streptomyces sp. A1547]|nr:hypothetical protein [Streptomyces sp. A1547]
MLRITLPVKKEVEGGAGLAVTASRHNNAMVAVNKAKVQAGIPS